MWFKKKNKIIELESIKCPGCDGENLSTFYTNCAGCEGKGFIYIPYIQRKRLILEKI